MAIPGNLVKKCLAALVWLLIGTACSSGDRQLVGIWHTEFESVPNLKSAFDFELRHDLFTGKWSGRFELAEVMIAADLPGIEVKDSAIKLDLGAGATFDGRISADRTVINGVLRVPGQKADTLRFEKAERWSSQRPARIDSHKQALLTWQYTPPDSLGDGWEVGDLSENSPGPKRMQELFQQILRGQYHGLDALLVARNGRLVLEEYFYLGGRDRIHSVQSVTKSVTSLLIGIAHDQGLIKDLDVPLRSFFPAYADSSQAAASPTLRHALTMSAALDWTEDIPYSDPRNDAVGMNGSKDMYQYVLSKKTDPTDRPGERFEYNSGISVLLGGVLLKATGKPADQYAQQTLFADLGIQKFSWSSGGGQVHTGGGLFLKPRDLLKIGQLVLDGGQWRGKQVVSSSWIKESTAFNLPINASGGDAGYGYQWWRGGFPVGEQVLPVIYASGYGGQMLYIVPDLDLLVLTLHHNPTDVNGSHSISWKEIGQIIIPAVRDLSQDK
nr:serine hydrolase [uncultured Dyadobacter sp.]